MELGDRERRIACLHEWQRYYNMEPRDDSRLTQLFADGQTANMSVDEVARELMATDFIHRHTLYGDVIEDYMRAVATRLRAAHPGLSWTRTWEIVRAYAPIALKLMCLSSADLVVPDRMPS
jgi:hypothetical protein